MPETLSYGYVKPESGDKGSVFFPDLEDDIDQLNDHNHDGSNSAKLTAVSSDAVTANITAVGWVSSGSGYRQLVTMPAGMTVDATNITFRESVSGDLMMLHFAKASSTTYYVYCNDNSIALKAVYTT